MRTFAIMYRPKGQKVYTNHYYHTPEGGHNVATISGNLTAAQDKRDALAAERPDCEFAVFEMVEVRA